MTNNNKSNEKKKGKRSGAKVSADGFDDMLAEFASSDLANTEITIAPTPATDSLKCT